MSPWILAAAMSCTHAAAPLPSTDGTATGAAEPARYEIWEGEVKVLTVVDRPGPLVSTASLPPGVTPAAHPFLSGTAHSAFHEHMLREALQGSTSTSEFLQALRDRGLDVRPVIAPRGPR